MCTRDSIFKPVDSKVYGCWFPEDLDCDTFMSVFMILNQLKKIAGPNLPYPAFQRRPGKATYLFLQNKYLTDLTFRHGDVILRLPLGRTNILHHCLADQTISFEPLFSFPEVPYDFYQDSVTISYTYANIHVNVRSMRVSSAFRPGEVMDATEWWLKDRPDVVFLTPGWLYQDLFNGDVRLKTVKYTSVYRKVGNFVHLCGV